MMSYNKAYYVGYGETTFFLFAREAPGHSEFEFRELRKRDQTEWNRVFCLNQIRIKWNIVTKDLMWNALRHKSL